MGRLAERPAPQHPACRFPAVAPGATVGPVPLWTSQWLYQKHWPVFQERTLKPMVAGWQGQTEGSIATPLKC